MSTISLGRSGIVGISYSETNLLKSNLMRANDRRNSASNNINSAKVKLQVNGSSGRIRVESNNLQSYYSSLKGNNGKIEKIIRDIDYIVRRFKEVDSRCASRVRAISRGYKLHSSISRIGNTLISFGSNVFNRVSSFLKEGKSIIDKVTKSVGSFFGNLYNSVSDWFERNPVVGSAISFGLNVLALVGAVATIVAGGPVIAIVGAVVGGVLALNGLIDDGTRIYNNVAKGENKGFNPIESTLKAVAGEKAGGTIYGVINIVDFALNLPNMVKGVFKGIKSIGKVGESLVDVGKSIVKVIKKAPEIVSDFKGSIKNIPSYLKNFKNVSVSFIKDIGDGIKNKGNINLKFATTGIDVDDINDLSKIDNLEIPELNDIQKNYNKIVNDGESIEGAGSHLKNYSVEDFKREMDKLPHAKILTEIRDEIIRIPKGQKPDPSMYMINSEIKEHLSLFDDGAVRIQSKESFEKAITLYRSNIGDPTTGTFVLPKSIVNKAVEASNGNPRILEELLGLDPGYLGEHPIILHINNPSNVRIPSGNEAGAWPEYWIPGGYTSGGVPEAVIDQIPAGGYTTSSVYNNQ